MERGRTFKAFFLALSLGLNVFFIAYFGTQVWGNSNFLAVTASPPALMSRVADRLPKADSDILWRSYRQAEERIRTAQRTYRVALATAAAQLVRQEIDKDAFAKAVGDAREKRLAVGDLTLEVFVDAFPKMSTEGRRQLLTRSLPAGLPHGDD
jgi:uncharacterized membrane protein